LQKGGVSVVDQVDANAENLVLQRRLTALQAENDKLQDQVGKVYTSAGANEALLVENTQSKVVNYALTKDAELKTDQLIKLQGNLDNTVYELDRTKKELSRIERLFLEEQQKKVLLEHQVEAINKKTQAAFEMADISKYLTGVINEFNEAVNTGDASVNYIIKELDIEMKAYVAKTEDSRLLLAAPSLAASGEEALSCIKFSIGAVPKDISPK
jgi:hypothetical protein